MAGIVYPLSSPPLPRFGIDCNPRAFFPISFLPLPRYFVSRCFVKGPLLYFSRWLASTDYLAGCHLELRIPDNSFPLMVLYEERLFPPPPLPHPGVHENDYRWKFLENWNRGTATTFRRIYLNLFNNVIRKVASLIFEEDKMDFALNFGIEVTWKWLKILRKKSISV